MGQLSGMFQGLKRDCCPRLLYHIFSLSLRFSCQFSNRTWVSRYQNVSILGFIGAKDGGGGGDNWSYKTYKAPVKFSPTNKPTPSCLQAVSLHPLSVRARK